MNPNASAFEPPASLFESSEWVTDPDEYLDDEIDAAFEEMMAAEENDDDTVYYPPPPSLATPTPSTETPPPPSGEAAATWAAIPADARLTSLKAIASLGTQSLQELASKAAREDWGHDMATLRTYLKRTFTRLCHEGKVLGYGTTPNGLPLRLTFNTGLLTEDSTEIYAMLLHNNINAYLFDAKQAFIGANSLLSSTNTEHFYKTPPVPVLPKAANFFKFAPNSRVESVLLNSELLGDLKIDLDPSVLFPPKILTGLPQSLRTLQPVQLKIRLMAALPAVLARVRAAPLLALPLVHNVTSTDGITVTDFALALPVTLEQSQTSADLAIVVTFQKSAYVFRKIATLESVRRGTRPLGGNLDEFWTEKDKPTPMPAKSHQPSPYRQNEPPVCKFWANNGNCRNGANCSFRHE